MKTIKIKFVGFWSDFAPEKLHIYRCLCKHYNVEICEDADYIICSVFGTRYDYCNYPQVRIMYVGENYIPDFNLVDYGICNYPVSFGDRCFYLPFFIDEYGHCEALETKDRNYPDSILEEKPYFANFIAGHESEGSIRGEFFKKLCEYKRVESPGRYLNNMPDHQQVRWDNASKTDFQRKSKFTLCFESTAHYGFITEKLTDAFYADTIPVYYGSPTVSEFFNPEAFIDCSAYESLDAVIEKIKELDNDDEAYLKMLRAPIFNEPQFVTKKLKQLEDFVCHIFEQSLEQAYRRSRVYTPAGFDRYLQNAAKRKQLFRKIKYYLQLLKKKFLHQ